MRPAVYVIDQLETGLRAAMESGAPGDIELSLVAADIGATRFAGSNVTQAIAVEEVTVRARVALGDRIGAARGNDLSTGALAALCARAAEVAASAPPVPGFRGLPGPAPYPVVPGALAESTLHTDARDRTECLRGVFALFARERATAAGVLQTGCETIAVVSSRGVRAGHARSTVRFELIATRETGGRLPPFPSGHASFYGHDFGALKPVPLAERAAEAAARSVDPVALPPGPFDVVLGPVALAEAIEWMAFASFGARAMLDGSSLCAGRLGERVTGANVTLYDDGAAEGEGATPLPFDGEGTPKRRLPLLAGGIARAAASDSLSAAALGGVSSGHAPLATGDPSYGPLPQNLFLAPGTARDEEDLVARVERGLYVPRFHYVNGLLDPRRALTTGMTRDGACLIEGGKKTRGIRNLRFTESLLDALGRMDGATRTRRACAPHILSGPVVVPAALIRRFTFTGTS